MSLNGRVRKLERRLGVSGPCSTCDSRGWGAVVVIDKEDPPDKPPKPRGCPECGKVRSVKRIVLCGDAETPPKDAK